MILFCRLRYFNIFGYRSTPFPQSDRNGTAIVFSSEKVSQYIRNNIADADVNQLTDMCSFVVQDCK